MPYYLHYIASSIYFTIWIKPYSKLYELLNAKNARAGTDQMIRSCFFIIVRRETSQLYIYLAFVLRIKEEEIYCRKHSATIEPEPSLINMQYSF